MTRTLIVGGSVGCGGGGGGGCGMDGFVRDKKRLALFFSFFFLVIL